MASLCMLIAVAIVAISFPPTLAMDYVVGDDKGWTLNFDYQAWAQGKQFHVGDKLIFKYAPGAHNVYRVDGTAFQQCLAPANAVALTSGNDTITLAAPGNKWYICGIGKHCESGKMKLSITVLPQVETVESPIPSPSSGQSPIPDSPPTSAGITFSKHYPWMIGTFGIVATMINY